jgi:hypothetical protein
MLFTSQRSETLTCCLSRRCHLTCGAWQRVCLRSIWHEDVHWRPQQGAQEHHLLCHRPALLRIMGKQCNEAVSSLSLADVLCVGWIPPCGRVSRKRCPHCNWRHYLPWIQYLRCLPNTPPLCRLQAPNTLPLRPLQAPHEGCRPLHPPSPGSLLLHNARAPLYKYRLCCLQRRSGSLRSPRPHFASGCGEL